jgi:hypothetical protein
MKYSPEGSFLGIVPLPSEPADGVDFILHPEGGLRPFNTEIVYAWSPFGYLVVGRNDQYRIEMQKATGTVVISRDLDRIELESEEHEEWIAFRERVRSMLAQRGAPEAKVNEIPRRKPFFRSIYAAEDGRLWVLRYAVASKRHDIEPVPGSPGRPLLTWREASTYDVFDSDGVFLGPVVFPNEFRPHVFRGLHAWGVHAEPEAERIVRLRVVPWQ